MSDNVTVDTLTMIQISDIKKTATGRLLRDCIRAENSHDVLHNLASHLASLERIIAAVNASREWPLDASSVETLLNTSKSRPVAYLCRVYLQFGADAMSAGDLTKLRTALARLETRGVSHDRRKP